MKAVEIKNKKAAIVGFGMEGRDVYSFIKKCGGSADIFDVKEKQDLDLKGMSFEGSRFYCGKDYDLQKLPGYDFIVRSPGVYRYIPELLICDKKRIEVTSAIKLFFDNCPARTIGVTGTKGKGTTSTLIYEILKNSGKRVYLAGNIGKPCLSLIGKLKTSDWVVLELSSFQLIDLTKSPDIAVVLNITVDHLDWHKNRREYIDAKRNIVLHQKSGSSAVINADYPDVKVFSKLGSGKKYFFSKKSVVKGAYVKSGKIYADKTEIGTVQKLLLRGNHNWENIAAAIWASRLANASISSIKKTIFEFRGLEHRLELVKVKNGISFYNDSFSTNPQTTIAAIHSFSEPITIILGGFDKNLDYRDMCREITKCGVFACILIGDIAPKIKKALNEAKYKGKVIETGYVNMKSIIRECIKLTPRGGVIILSPATSSFDMFENYKVRGKIFKKEVYNIH